MILPADVTTNWKYYRVTYSHAVTYFLCLVILSWVSIPAALVALISSSYSSLVVSVQYLIVWPIVIVLRSWSLCGLFSIGHDAIHEVFAPRGTFSGRFLNFFAGWICLDCLFCSQQYWAQLHWLADHANDGFMKQPKTLSPVRRMETNNGISATVYSFFKESMMHDVDVIMQLKRESIAIFVGLVIRIYLWHSLGFANFMAIVVSCVVIISFQYNTPHMSETFHDDDFQVIDSRPTSMLSVDAQIDDKQACTGLPAPADSKHFYLSENKTKTNPLALAPLVKVCRNSKDFKPESFVASFLLGGVNAHAAHHCFPGLPRGSLPFTSKILHTVLTNDYRACQDSKQWIQTFAFNYQIGRNLP